MSESEDDTERVTVRTYVPRYQRERWDEEADDLDMSRSEFVRSMVQAGRSGFLDDQNSDGSTTKSTDSGDAAEARVGTVSDLEDRVVDTLAADEYRSWDELLAAVTDGIEDRLEAALQDLQAEGRVTYSGRNGGYTLDE